MAKALMRQWLSAFLLSNFNAPIRSNTTCCDILDAALPGQVSFPSSSTYTTSQEQYFSLSQRDLHPQCRVSAQSPADVSFIVQTASEQECPFAVHAGGHSSMPSASNIDARGFTIDLEELQTLEYVEGTEKGAVTVGAGLRWGAVFDMLAKDSLTVVGGRDPNVGVGGFLLGGGISFLSFEHGLGGDNIINYEIVLGTGEIVNANESAHSDLWWALKAGSSNFGIVTSYTLKTFPLTSPFWAGIQVFGLSDAPAIVSGFPTYIEATDQNPEAALTNIMYTRMANQYAFSILMGFRTNSPQPQLYKTLVESKQPIVDGTVLSNGISDALTTIQSPPVGPRLALYTRTLHLDRTHFHDSYLYLKALFEEQAVNEVEGLYWLLGLQPLPKSYFPPGSPISHHGGNNLMLMMLTVGWSNAADNDLVRSYSNRWLQWTDEVATERGILHPFLYMNYANSTQNAYEADLDETGMSRMKQTRDKYDPKGVFWRLMDGGHKIPLT